MLGNNSNRRCFMPIVSDEKIIKVLRQYNSWWRNPAAVKEESKPQKRIAYYEALKIIKHKSLRRFAVLSGARRVGKTTRGSIQEIFCTYLLTIRL